MKMKKLASISVLVLLIAMLLSACGEDNISLSTVQDDFRSDDTPTSLDLSAEEPSSESETETQELSNEILDDDDIYYIIVDGRKFCAGDDISDLYDAGYTLGEFFENSELPPKQATRNNAVFSDTGLFSISAYNPTDSAITATDGVIWGVSFAGSTGDTPTNEIIANAEIYGGIKLGMTREDVEKVLGKPTKMLGGDDNYTYVNGKGDRKFAFKFNSDGELQIIRWEWIVPDD